MKKLQENIESAKDDFIIYCLKKFEKDFKIKDKIKDIRYLYSKKQSKIDFERQQEYKKSFYSKIKGQEHK